MLPDRRHEGVSGWKATWQKNDGVSGSEKIGSYGGRGPRGRLYLGHVVAVRLHVAHKGCCSLPPVPRRRASCQPGSWSRSVAR